MNKDISGLIIFLLVVSPLPLHGQDFISNSAVTGICYAGNKVNRIYVPPPDKFLRKSATKGVGSIKIYYSGFPDQALAAVEYAASILKSMLPGVNMSILATWDKTLTAGVLGNSSITGYAAGWGIDALNPWAYYPVALAEKIAGESLNTDQEGDMILRINSTSEIVSNVNFVVITFTI